MTPEPMVLIVTAIPLQAMVFRKLPDAMSARVN